MQSVSMKCSKEQYQQDLKQALAELGYVEMLRGSDDQARQIVNLAAKIEKEETND